MMASAGAQLREMMAQGLVVAPGVYDGITAKLVQAAGHKAAYMTGAATSASLGYPDFGLVTMTEMVANAERITRTIDIPVICDADTGYGNELNVTRTVKEYERRGVGGIHIEDQEFPKKCGHLENKTLIPREAYFAKIRAAAVAREDKDFVIIARTDSRAVMSFDEAVERCNGALAAGADVAFFEAPQTMEEVEKVPKLVNGPCLLNIVHRGKTPKVELSEAEAMGYKIAILPSLIYRNVLGATEAILAELATGKMPTPTGDISPIEGFRKFGADEWDKLRTAFRDSPKQDAAE
jgi:2-methylisocitrate lyase-like PEP mutase family enzyme